MSIVLCGCGAYVDSDYDAECFMPDDSVACGHCRDAREVCERCENLCTSDGACYDEGCEALRVKEQASEDRHNDPHRR